MEHVENMQNNIYKDTNVKQSNYGENKTQQDMIYGYQQDDLAESNEGGFIKNTVLPALAGMLLALFITSLYFKPWESIVELREMKLQQKTYNINMKKQQVNTEDLGQPVIR